MGTPTEDANDRMLKRHRDEQLFYGWFDDVAQTVPTYSPPLGGPCPLCGRNMTLLDNDVRTHSLMYPGQYGARSYFYRTHRTCDEREASGVGADSFILDLIARNGD